MNESFETVDRKIASLLSHLYEDPYIRRTDSSIIFTFVDRIKCELIIDSYYNQELVVDPLELHNAHDRIDNLVKKTK